jgi:hypothetical protein
VDSGKVVEITTEPVLGVDQKTPIVLANVPSAFGSSVMQARTIKADFVDCLVSECIATLRSVGTSTEIPIQGLKIGTARLPLIIFEKIPGVSRSFGKSEIEVSVTEGILKIASWRYKSDTITVGTIPDQRIDLPVNASITDTLALAELLSSDQLIQQGLHRRVEEAREIASEAISKAILALKPLDISREQVQQLVDEHVRHVSSGLSTALVPGQHS